MEQQSDSDYENIENGQRLSLDGFLAKNQEKNHEMHQDKKKLQHAHNLNSFEWRKNRALFGQRMSSNIVLGPIGNTCDKKLHGEDGDDDPGDIEPLMMGETEKRPFVDKLIISSKSAWKSYFDIIILLLVGYSCQSTLLYVAFGQPTNPFHLGVD